MNLVECINFVYHHQIDTNCLKNNMEHNILEARTSLLCGANGRIGIRVRDSNDFINFTKAQQS
jgi:hypothetical protein